MMLCDAPRLMFCGIGRARGGIGREQRVISGQREAHCMVQGGLVDPALNAEAWWILLSMQDPTGPVRARRLPKADRLRHTRFNTTPNR